MSEDRREAQGEGKQVHPQGAAPQEAQGQGKNDLGLAGGADGAKRGDNGKPSDVKMDFDVKMGAYDVKMGAYDVKMGAYDVKMDAYDVKMGFAGEADKKK